MAQHRARADTVFFCLFEHKQEDSKQRAANFRNFCLRFLKRYCSTKSTRCELNQCFGISVTAVLVLLSFQSPSKVSFDNDNLGISGHGWCPGTRDFEPFKILIGYL